MESIFDLLNEFGTIVLTWLPLAFLGVIVFLIWRTLQMMPRPKRDAVDAGERVNDDAQFQNATDERLKRLDKTVSDLASEVERLREQLARR